MNALTTAAIVLACVFGGALIGLFLGGRLPRHHLAADSKDIVKLGIGVVATMAALVLSLLVSTAKGSFDRMSDELTLMAANTIQFDRTLAQYGPETKEIRDHLRKQFQTVVDALFSGDPSHLARFRGSSANGVIGDVQSGLHALVPRSDAQRALLSRALALSQEVDATRWLLVLQDRDTISMPLLVVVVSWLTLIFVGFGLLSPRNGTVVTGALFLCALCVSGAIFLILEMDRPLDGMIRISDAPMRAALAILLAS